MPRLCKNKGTKEGSMITKKLRTTALKLDFSKERNLFNYLTTPSVLKKTISAM